MCFLIVYVLVDCFKYALRNSLSVYSVVYQIHTQLYDGQSLVNRGDQSMLSPV